MLIERLINWFLGSLREAWDRRGDLGVSELLLHFAVPFAAFSYFRRPREAFLASLIALAPDMDVVIHVHRSWTHSLVIILSVCAVALMLAKVLKPRLLGFGFLATLALVSHLLLDTFTTYTPVLWPLVSYSLFIGLNGGVRIGSDVQAYLKPEVSLKPTVFTHFQYLDAPVFTSEGFIIAVILVSFALLSRYGGRLRGRST